jgi:glycosyltransferase involved in cell wall biosynthesis
MSEEGDRPLKVLIVAQPTEYGVAICVRQQAEAAVAAGHEVTVACPDETRGPLAGWIARTGAEHVVLNLRRQPGLGDFGAVAKLRRLSRGRDIVHVHSSKAGAVGRIAVATLPKRKRPAILFTTHYWSWQVGGKLAPVYLWIERLLARKTDAIVAVSEQEAEEGRESLGSGADRITVIPNGVDRTHFSPQGEVADRGDDPLVVCVGRLSKQKGQDIAIRAMALLENGAARLRLVGDEYPPGQRDRLQDLAESLGVGDRIEWWGKVADAAPQFRAADVTIAPSRWEGMSLVFLEAMACGTAMIVTDVAGSQALGSAGVVVPLEDPESLATEIDALLADPGGRRQLGMAARERSATFDLDLTLSRTLDLWAELAARGNPAQSISANAAR